ncbi:MAG: ankyrin repeat domain-containing protein [Rickettsiella sp.]|nr:ankyrin repeat domain-containing protein [Rickettsiella sp.]
MDSFVHEILFGTLEGIERFILAGVDIEETDEYGFSPLIEAAIANKTDVAALLLEYGADINKADTTGRSALHWAVDNHNMDLCQLLLANKADPNAHTAAGQPILVYPLLRQQVTLKKLLYQYGAKLSFAQDFIQAKLLGHRYELAGQVDIINPTGRFIEIDYEGFFLEFTLDVITYSLRRYRNNFSSRHLRSYFADFQKIIHAFAIAQALLKYQRYTININDHKHSIDALLDQEIVLLPVAFEGHAIAFIKYKDWFIRCDRGENSQREGSIVVYQVQNSTVLDFDYCKQLIFTRQTRKFITQTIHHELGLRPITILPIAAQIRGNCSWANIEACIPAMLFVLQLSSKKTQSFQTLQSEALEFYQSWRHWDKDRALEECIKGFYIGNKARQASKATLLGAILFQNCTQDSDDIKDAENILKILTLPEFNYILKSYLTVYWKHNKTLQGKRLITLLDACGVSLETINF